MLTDPSRPQDHDDSAALRMQVRRLDADLPLPRYAKPGDAGLDLRASSDAVLDPGARALIGA